MAGYAVDALSALRGSGDSEHRPKRSQLARRDFVLSVVGREVNRNVLEFPARADSTGTAAAGARVMEPPLLARLLFAGRRLFGRSGLGGVVGADNREQKVVI